MSTDTYSADILQARIASLRAAIATEEARQAARKRNHSSDRHILAETRAMLAVLEHLQRTSTD